MKTTSLKKLAKEFNTARLARNLTIKDCSAIVGVSYGTLWKFGSGQATAMSPKVKEKIEYFINETNHFDEKKYVETYAKTATQQPTASPQNDIIAAIAQELYKNLVACGYTRNGVTKMSKNF